ncbi:hypothetical protein DFH08DRAFT_1071570 [Mycena albidolilacea]|uniref:Uncharacterized protein n=1 Tax=Mycena albidolilacea TaxID=1033008 RepID=A0AAD7F7D0_9AGAR|nr:hypothetical protein DFH08DRAFT_1071570 [Mycena albidolilacea]
MTVLTDARLDRHGLRSAKRSALRNPRIHHGQETRLAKIMRFLLTSAGYLLTKYESTLPIEASDSEEPSSTLIPALAPESTLPVGALASDEAPTFVSAAASVSIGAPSTDEAPSDSDDSDVSADGEVSDDSGLADAAALPHYSKQASALADLDDDEIITLLKHVASKNSQSKRAFSDLSDDKVITLLKYVASKSAKRETSLNDLD